jgi:signal transduction histidine kinase
MKTPDIPANETDRLYELNEYSLLDTLPEEDYDNIVYLASQICDTPIALISLVDTNRQWFKSVKGLNITETPRDYSFCAHAINKPKEVMIVSDSRTDERFFDNPYVVGEPNLVFYAGVPLVSQKGNPLGTLCVIDLKPHKQLTEEQLQALKVLSNNVVKLFELHKSKLELESAQVVLEQRNKELEHFASMAAHDLKSPLGNISSIIELLKFNHSNVLNNQAKELLDLLDESSQQLRDLIDGILEYTRADALLLERNCEIKLPDFFVLIEKLLCQNALCKLTYPLESRTIKANKAALKQVLLNLITNGITYNRSPQKKIDIAFSETAHHYHFSVTDDGLGIATKNQEKIFNLFERIPIPKTDINKGHGIGLSTVKKLVERLGGEVTLESELGKGSTFSFSLLKQ